MEYEPIVTQRFKEVERVYDDGHSTKREFSNKADARLTFIEALRKRGYWPEGGHVWVHPLYAAVMVP